MEWTVTKLSNIDPFTHVHQAYEKNDTHEKISEFESDYVGHR